MEKILIANNPSKIDKNFIDFSIYIAGFTRAKVIGMFPDAKAELKEPAMKTHYAMPDTALGIELDSERSIAKYQEQHTRSFENAFVSKGFSYSVHPVVNDPEVEIIKESRFADLLILDPEMSLNGDQEEVPTDFVKRLLSMAECPVVLSPYSFDGVDEILFAYDGSASSVFAMKQFIHLFPRYRETKVTGLQVNDTNLTITEKDKIRELLQAHYSKINFIALEGKGRDELFSYLIDKKNVFVVMGAFGRSMISTLFKPSTANLVLKIDNLPVFITHH